MEKNERKTFIGKTNKGEPIFALRGRKDRKFFESEHDEINEISTKALCETFIEKFAIKDEEAEALRKDSSSWDKGDKIVVYLAINGPYGDAIYEYGKWQRAGGRSALIGPLSRIFKEYQN